MMAEDRSNLTDTSSQIAQSIHVIRDQKVLLSFQLAEFYGVDSKRLNEQVKRNIQRFPEDFMFQLTNAEWSNLKSQFATSSNRNHGGLRKMPYAFTEQGVAMLSSVIRSKRAVEVNIEIMRAFVKLRQLFTMNQEIANRLLKLESDFLQQGQQTEKQIQKIFGLLQQLFNPSNPKKGKIGFRPK